MNKQQIINHIAIRLNSILLEPVYNEFLAKDYAKLLQEITRDDDYSLSNYRQDSPLQAGTGTPSYPTGITNSVSSN